MKKIILIVEDEVNIAKAEKMILNEEFSVHLAHDGNAGLALAKQIKPDVVILDVMMPGLSGFEVCHLLRQESDLKHTRIVMVTAKNQEKDELQGITTGADDYIMKPFEPEELVHVIRQVLHDDK